MSTKPRRLFIRTDMSADQVDCFDLLSDAFGGDHHLPDVYEYGRGIKCSVYSGKLSTWDFNYLTRLVVLAHDRCIRVEIVQGAPGRVGLVLHRRHCRDGATHDRHPTMDEAIGLVRGQIWR